MKIRAKDIADRLGLSTATISNILNNKPGVSAETKTLVLNELKRLNCEYLLKDTSAKTLEQNGYIGFVVYKNYGTIISESPFFNYTLETITQTAQQNNYNIKFIYLDKYASLSYKISQLENSNCDGLIINAVEMQTDDLKLFSHINIPFIFLDNSFQTDNVDCIAINNVQGTYNAMEHLYAMGHRKIGYIKSNIPITSFKERFAEYQLHLKELGLEYISDYVVEIEYTEKQAKETIAHYLKNPCQPTAFLADNDLLAVFAMQAFKENGYVVPDDVSFIGFDDRPICTMIEPKLTTIAVPKDLFGASAISMLINKLSQQYTSSIKINIGTSLIIRDSVKQISQ